LQCARQLFGFLPSANRSARVQVGESGYGGRARVSHDG